MVKVSKHVLKYQKFSKFYDHSCSSLAKIPTQALIIPFQKKQKKISQFSQKILLLILTSSKDQEKNNMKTYVIAITITT